MAHRISGSIKIAERKEKSLVVGVEVVLYEASIL
jgi:hypothetical protein